MRGKETLFRSTALSLTLLSLSGCVSSHNDEGINPVPELNAKCISDPDGIARVSYNLPVGGQVNLIPNNTLGDRWLNMVVESPGVIKSSNLGENGDVWLTQDGFVVRLAEQKYSMNVSRDGENTILEFGYNCADPKSLPPTE